MRREHHDGDDPSVRNLLFCPAVPTRRENYRERRLDVATTEPIAAITSEIAPGSGTDPPPTRPPPAPLPGPAAPKLVRHKL